MPLVVHEQSGRGSASQMLAGITLRAYAEKSMHFEVVLAKLSRKTSSQGSECPYCKPTQVGE